MTEPKSRNTTKLQFEQFKESFLKYVDILGLKDWKVYFEVAPVDVYARIHIQWSGRVATVQMCTEVAPDSWSDFDPVASGKHEAIHLLLAYLEGPALKRFTSLEAIAEANEAVTRVLEKLI